MRYFSIFKSSAGKDLQFYTLLTHIDDLKIEYIFQYISKKHHSNWIRVILTKLWKVDIYIGIMHIIYWIILIVASHNYHIICWQRFCGNILELWAKFECVARCLLELHVQPVLQNDFNGFSIFILRIFFDHVFHIFIVSYIIICQVNACAVYTAANFLSPAIESSLSDSDSHLLNQDPNKNLGSHPNPT